MSLKNARVIVSVIINARKNTEGIKNNWIMVFKCYVYFVYTERQEKPPSLNASSIIYSNIIGLARKISIKKYVMV